MDTTQPLLTAGTADILSRFQFVAVFTITAIITIPFIIAIIAIIATIAIIGTIAIATIFFMDNPTQASDSVHLDGGDTGDTRHHLNSQFSYTM